MAKCGALQAGEWISEAKDGVLASILALKKTRIVAVHLEPDGLVLDVASDHARQ